MSTAMVGAISSSGQLTETTTLAKDEPICSVVTLALFSWNSILPRDALMIASALQSQAFPMPVATVKATFSLAQRVSLLAGGPTSLADPAATFSLKLPPLMLRAVVTSASLWQACPMLMATVEATC